MNGIVLVDEVYSRRQMTEEGRSGYECRLCGCVRVCAWVVGMAGLVNDCEPEHSKAGQNKAEHTQTNKNKHKQTPHKQRRGRYYCRKRS
jgi:hypothetical protein